MDRHTCKNCERLYNYCRSCVLKPIPWREAGFCSKECSAEFKAAQKVEAVATEIVVETEVAPIETQEPVAELEIKPVTKKKIKKEKEMNPSIDSYTSSFSIASAPIEDIKTALEIE